jgi:hypothetical protein
VGEKLKKKQRNTRLLPLAAVQISHDFVTKEDKSVCRSLLLLPDTATTALTPPVT